MLIHLGMSGRLEWEHGHIIEPDHLRAAWKLSGGARLLFCDARKFGRIKYTRDPNEALGRLGLEPLARNFTVDALVETLQSRSRQLKPLLLEQSAVAGLGNIYIDEALHRARLHPLVRSDQLRRTEIRRLHQSIQRVLREAIRRCGTSFDWAYPGGTMQGHLRAYGRKGLPCHRCGAAIARILVGQRSTHFCPACQALPGPRSKRR
jgi:formamidopyrimidine-DNA glycosylase